MFGRMSFPVVVFLALVLAVSGRQPLDALGQPIRPGEQLVTTSPAPLEKAERRLLVVEKGTKLVATDVQGDWIGVAVRQGDKEVGGWIHSKHLIRLDEKIALDRAIGMLRAMKAGIGIRTPIRMRFQEGEDLIYEICLKPGESVSGETVKEGFGPPEKITQQQEKRFVTIGSDGLCGVSVKKGDLWSYGSVTLMLDEDGKIECIWLIGKKSLLSELRREFLQ